MSFADHKIQKFTQTITRLPDQPNLSAGDLKACFDSSPEELRQAVNSICDDADQLRERVDSIITETFGDTITKSMLSDELTAELDAKATQTALAEEVVARKNAAASETAAREALAEDVARKCELYYGSYSGDGAESQFIELGFTPQAVYLIRPDGITCESARPWYYGGLALPNHPAQSSYHNIMEITEGGFLVYYKENNYIFANEKNRTMYYLAFR